MTRFKSSFASHVGMVRKLNEDSFIARDDLGLWAVADGMGGHKAGDLASQTVVQKLDQVANCGSMPELVHEARQALERANEALVQLANQYESSRVPGSTVAVLAIKGSEVAALWAGDSRIYRLRDNQLAQITRDHSHVQELVDQQLISEEEAESHPMANVITRAVGIDDGIDLDVLHFDAQPGDRFLLCSDGLSRLVSLDEMQRQMQNQDLEESVQSLMHTALVRGAPDNVTIVMVAND